METIREVLMNSTDDDLSMLAGYMLDSSTKEINTYNDADKRYLHVNELVFSFSKMAQTFFYTKMEYGDLVCKLAEGMEIDRDKKSYIGTDVIELAITKKYIGRNLKYIPDEQKEELGEILGCNHAKTDVDHQYISKELSKDLSDLTAYRLTTWLADATLQSFLGKGKEWDSEGILFFGRKEFRQHVIYPVVCVTMLRHKYRYNQVPKCDACMAVIVPGAKFCNECGTRLVV